MDGRFASALQAAVEALIGVALTAPDEMRAYFDVDVERGAWRVDLCSAGMGPSDLAEAWRSYLSDEDGGPEPESSSDPPEELRIFRGWEVGQPEEPWQRALERDGFLVLVDAGFVALTDDPSWGGGFGVAIWSGGAEPCGSGQSVRNALRALRKIEKRSDARLLAAWASVYAEVEE